MNHIDALIRGANKGGKRWDGSPSQIVVVTKEEIDAEAARCATEQKTVVLSEAA